MPSAAADLQHPWKAFRVEIRNEALCSGENWQNRPSDSSIFFRRKFYKSQFLHLLIHRETLKSLLVTSPLSIKENIAIKIQNRVSMVQKSKEIIRWQHRCSFKLVLVMLKTWVFWVMSDLDAIRHSQRNVCWQLITTTLLFIKLGNQMPGYKSPQSAGPTWVSGLFFWKEMRFVLPIKIPVVTPPTTSNQVCYIKMADQGIEILII